MSIPLQNCRVRPNTRLLLCDVAVAGLTTDLICYTAKALCLSTVSHRICGGVGWMGVGGGVWIRAGLARGSTVGVGAVDRLSLLLPIASELIAAQMGSERLKRIHRHGRPRRDSRFPFWHIRKYDLTASARSSNNAYFATPSLFNKSSWQPLMSRSRCICPCSEIWSRRMRSNMVNTRA